LSLSFSFFLMIGLSLGLGSGCYSLDAPPGQFRCDQPGDACPSGMQCIAGACRPRTDENLPPAPDPDAQVDLAAPAAGRGCTGPSRLLVEAASGRLMVACTGRFDAGKAGTLCAAGYRPCSSADMDLFAEASQSRCSGLPGFFVADVKAVLLASGDAECQNPTSGTPFLVGCGGSSQDGGSLLKKPCAGLTVGLPCSGQGTQATWSCTTSAADASHSAAESGGALCCTR
jgi:hypothetical protein